MEVKGIAVMRRRADSWLNATQILKVAGIEKGKRTKVLEKEILIGEHEKVQGGYGKYQGTWIKFDKGLEFCKQYGVEELLRPLLTYDMGQDGNPPGGGGAALDTPTKEQALAAMRKRMYNAGGERGQGGSGTFFKNISATASHAVAAISKARFDSPGPRMRNGASARPPSFSRQSSQQQLDDGFPASQQSVQSFASDATYANGTGVDSAYATQSQGAVFSQQMGSQPQNDFSEPPRKRMKPSPSASISLSQQTDGFYDAPAPLSNSQRQLRELSPTEANESFAYQNQSMNMSQSQPHLDDPQPLPPLPFHNTQAAESKRALLMSLFMDPSRADFSTHEAFLTLSPLDLDTPIDAKSHTALHWAATLARLPLIRALIEKGASIFRVNGSGETALMRSVAVTNCADQAAMPEVLEYLGQTIGIRDSLGRTVLHHIAITSAVKGRSQCSKYYLESLLEFVVRQGSAPPSQSTAGYGNSQSKAQRSMGIGRFMAEIVNAQDKRGDTALLFAARVNNRGIISQLIEVGADPGIGNKAGLRPVDYGIGDLDADVEGSRGKMAGMTSQRENPGDIISSITEMVRQTEEEFGREMEAKQAVIDNIHASLRQTSSSLGQATQQLKRLQELQKERSERVQKITNLRSAADEEGYRLQTLKERYPAFDRSLNGESNGEMFLGQPDQQFYPFDPRTSSAEISAHLKANPEALNGTVTKEQLRARIEAYRQGNGELEKRVGEMQRGSRKVQDKYRRVIALCTKTDEARIDGVLEGLWRAVESEGGDVELGRVREFLGRVEGVE